MTETVPHIALRPATADDAAMVFRWRNDPFIVARSTSQKLVEWEEHLAWFEATLKRDDRLIFIVLTSEESIGLARFDRIDDAACVISVYLLEEFTGRGLGVATIRQSCAAIFKEWSVKEVVACVRHDNREGRSGFLKAGFVERAEHEACEENHYSLVLQNPLPLHKGRAGEG